MSTVLHIVYRGREDYIRKSETVLEAVREQIRDIQATVRAKLAESVQGRIESDIFRMLFG